MNFAILNHGTVTALVGIMPTNWKQFEEIVPAPLNVMVGDTWDGTRFYHDGEIVLTPEEILQEEMADLYEALTILGVTE